MNRNLENQQYFFIDKKIEIINHMELFNLAIVRIINTTVEFVVDVNFIDNKPSTEKSISIKALVGGKSNDT
jgi:hypothetical protein